LSQNFIETPKIGDIRKNKYQPANITSKLLNAIVKKYPMIDKKNLDCSPQKK